MAEPKLYRLLDADRREILSPVPGKLGGHRRKKAVQAPRCVNARPDTGFP